MKSVLDGNEILANQTDDDIVLTQLDDGRLLPLPAGRLRPILQAVYDLYADNLDKDASVLQLSRGQAAELAHLEAATGGSSLEWGGCEALRDLGKRLKDFTGIAPVALPAGFAGTLRP